MAGGWDDRFGDPAASTRLVAALGDRVIRRELGRGDLVHLEGDPAETLSIVLCGQTLSLRYPAGAWGPQPVAATGPGGVIGDDCLQPGAVRWSTVRALGDVHLAVAYRGDLFDLASSDRGVLALLLEVLGTCARSAELAAMANASSSVDVRVGRWLLHLDEVYRPPGVERCELAITQEDLACAAATRRPTANRVLKGLERDGLMALGRGRMSVLDAPGLTSWLEARDE